MAGVRKRPQPQHPPEIVNLVHAEHPPDRSDRQRQQQDGQGGLAGQVKQCFGRVRSEQVGASAGIHEPETDRDVDQRDRARYENRRLEITPVDDRRDEPVKQAATPSASVELPKIHSGVEAGHLIAVPVEHQGRPVLEKARQPFPPGPGSSADDRRWDSRWRRTRTRAASAYAHVVCGILSVNRMRTIDLPLLKPYFHGISPREAARRSDSAALCRRARRPSTSAGASLRPCADPRRTGTRCRPAEARHLARAHAAS